MIRQRHALQVVVLVLGVQAIVTQSLLLREAQVLMFGCEFAWGVVLFACLLGVAFGAAGGGWAARSSGRCELVLVGAGLALAGLACLELWVFRGARAWLGVGPGELVPLTRAAWAALVFVSPASALVGFAFPFACRMASNHGAGESPGAGPLGRIYALESLGSLLGGAAFTFWAVENLTAITTAGLSLALAATAGGLMLAATGRRIPAAGLAGLAGIALVTSLLAGNRLDELLVRRHWHTVAPGHELAAHCESKYQHLAVGSRADQFSLYSDGLLAADFPDPYTYVPLAHLWMGQHPTVRRVLVLGGGVEGLLAEILRYPVSQVVCVQPDPRQIAIVEPFLPAADRAALGDPRVVVHHGDGRHFIKRQRDHFDLVIAPLPEPTSAQRARFYTHEFYGELRAAMTDRSVLCLRVAAAPGELSPLAAQYLASIRATLSSHFPELAIGWGNPAHILAATVPGLVSTDPGELERRYVDRGVQADSFHPAWFAGTTDWLDPIKMRRRADQLDRVKKVEISTDLAPVVYVQRLLLLDRMSGGRSGLTVDRLRKIGWPVVITLLTVAAAAALHGCRLRRRGDGWAKGAVVLAIASTGFVTMALSIIWLFAFQNLYGYVYQRIGWIVAIFMGGLVLGCALVSRRCRRVGPGRLSSHLWRWLFAVDFALASLALAAPTILTALGAQQSTAANLVLVEWAVSLLVALTGVLGGAAFAVAGGLQLAATGETASAAGTISSADHAGACAGALLTGIFLVPVLGTAAAAHLLAAVKLVSAGLVALAWHQHHHN